MNAHLRGLITTAGAPILDPTGGSLLGYPLVVAEKLPTKTAAVGATTPYGIFGDLKRALLMGQRGSLTMSISTEGTVGSDNLFEGIPDGEGYNYIPTSEKVEAILGVQKKAYAILQFLSQQSPASLR